MNVSFVVKELVRRYPGKKIVKNNNDNPTEIICEVESSSEHPEYSKTISVIDKSAVHFHKLATETYKAMKGELSIFPNGKQTVLKTGEKYQIKPWTIHWAEGNETWVEICSTPGWTPDDYTLVGKEEQIHISTYDSTWPYRFEEEKKKIEKTLGLWIVGGVHHVGSTSVPGLSAKPIIDIMVGVKNLEEAKFCINLLATIQYQYFPYKSEMMHWFCKPSLEHRTHHLYLMDPISKAWTERLAFRDYLRVHPETRQAYEILKIALAEKFRDDREAYTEAKTEFIQRTIQKALRKSGSRSVPTEQL